MSTRRLPVIKLFTSVLIACLLILTLETGVEAGKNRYRRSPFKKHKIVIVEGGVSEGQVESEGWSAPAPLPPLQVLPPEPAQTTIVDHHHHHHTVVDHHFHVNAPPPPPPPRKQASVYIEVNKQEEEEKLRKFQAQMDAKFEQMEREKQENLERIRKAHEEQLDKLSKIPQQIATDIDFFGQKIKEDIDSKRNRNEGVSIQIWKNKGGQVNSGGSSASTEVHHHHHYHVRPPPTQPPPPPPPPQRQYYDAGHDHLQKFMTFLEDAGSQFRVPVSEEGSASGSAESGERGNKGKGFRLSIWKSKGKRR